MSDLKEYEIRSRLNHAEQVKRFGWCICEGTDGEGQLAEDCPSTATEYDNGTSLTLTN